MNKGDRVKIKEILLEGVVREVHKGDGKVQYSVRYYDVNKRVCDALFDDDELELVPK